MITVKFVHAHPSNKELVDLLSIKDAFLASHPEAVYEGISQSTDKSKELSFAGDWKSPNELDKASIKRICSVLEVNCFIFNGSRKIESYSAYDIKDFEKDNTLLFMNKKDDKNLDEFSSIETETDLDKKQLGIKSFEEWLKNEEFAERTGKGLLIVVFLIASLLTFRYISKTGFDFYGIIGVIVSLGFLIPFFTAKKIVNKTEEYDKYVKDIMDKDAQTKERRAKIQKNIIELAEKKKEEIELKKEPYFKKIETIEAKLDSLKSVDIHSVGEYKSSVDELENHILERSNPETLQKFVRISKFLSNVESHLDGMRVSMIADFKSTNLRSKVLYELQKSPKQLENERLEYVEESLENTLEVLEGKRTLYLGSYSSELERLDKLMDLSILHSQKAIHSFENESEELKYLESMAISMIIFLLEGRNVRFFEIMEFFDGLGALDSSWEKTIKESLQGIKASLDNINDSITGLGDSINKMASNNELILSELKNLDSTLKFGNLVQSITAYNTYKISKELKSRVED